MPVEGLMALLGARVGAGPVNDESAIGCRTGGIGMFIVHGVVGGLAQLPQPVVPWLQLPLPQLPLLPPVPLNAYARELRPVCASSMPLLVRRPMRTRSRRVSCALISSCRFWKARCSSFHRAREIRSPLELKYMLSPGVFRTRSLNRRSIQPALDEFVRARGDAWRSANGRFRGDAAAAPGFRPWRVAQRKGAQRTV